MARRQGELFPEPIVAIHPDSTRGEPRLWVRRLMVWEDPEKLIRDIRLRRGLNVIWSPDPGIATAAVGRGDGSGHGAGKTLFCRLLRYCLGEDTFANDDLRRSIAEHLPNGLIGVEVMIDSHLWSAIRPIGTTRRQIVQSDTTLDELVISKDPSTGVQPMLDELSGLVTPKEGELFIPSTRAHADWLFTLAWLTRDQECRYDHILDWRHARADTRSPVLSTSVDERVSTVRSLLGVLDQAELDLKDEREELAETRRSLERDQTFYRRSIEQLRTALSAALGASPDMTAGGEIELGTWRTEAASRLEKETNTVDLSVQQSKLVAARKERDTVLGERAVVMGKLQQSEGMLEVHVDQLGVLRGERSNLSAAEIRAKLGAFCPVCLVPIDRALAQGCGLSHILPNPEAIAEQRTSLADQMRDQNAIVESFKADVAANKQELARLRNRQSELDEQIAALEEEIETASRQSRQQWTEKRRVLERVSELERAYDSLTQTSQAQAALEAKDETLKNRQAAMRATHKEVLQRFDELFSYVCRGVLGNGVTATVSLSGAGIQADVEVGGMAMESLKAIAFDLAAMLMSVEGRTVMPAFLMHDSPREADLGASIYHRWFKLIASLEALAGEPPFQYVITSTSEPPTELAGEPFLVAQFHGGNPAERILRLNV
jgi:hypothetical protein